MNEYAECWKNIMIGGFFCMILVVYFDFIRDPETYGKIMQRYDNARFVGTNLENME